MPVGSGPSIVIPFVYTEIMLIAVFSLDYDGGQSFPDAVLLCDFNVKSKVLFFMVDTASNCLPSRLRKAASLSFV